MHYTLTRKSKLVLLCTLLLIAVVPILGCDDWNGDGEAWSEWQNDVMERQRDEPPPASPTPERNE